MKRKRNLQTTLLLQLRKLGMICRKLQPYTHRLRIAKTVFPEGTPSSIEAEEYVFLQNKKLSMPKCGFDIDTKTCGCGISFQEFLTGQCVKSKQK